MGVGSFPILSLMLLGIHNDHDSSMTSMSLLLSQAMPLFLSKTETNKVLLGILSE